MDYLPVSSTDFHFILKSKESKKIVWYTLSSFHGYHFHANHSTFILYEEFYIS